MGVVLDLKKPIITTPAVHPLTILVLISVSYISPQYIVIRATTELNIISITQCMPALFLLYIFVYSTISHTLLILILFL